MSQVLTGQQVLNMVRGSGNDWYRIANQADPVRAEVWLYDEIGWLGTTAQDFASELADITAPAILVHLSSLGGAVFDGIAIFNALRLHPATVTVQIESMAASVASVVAQAGDERQMVTGSQMMIHDAHAILPFGTAAELREAADVLDKQTANIAAIYAERAGDGRKKSHFQALMAAVTWMNPAEAIAEGLADSIIKPDTGGTVLASTESAEDEEALDMTDFLASPEIVSA